MVPSQWPYNGSLVFDPWLEDIWGRWEDFEDYLKKIDITTDDDADRFKKIILRSIKEFYKNKQPIILDSDENEFYKKIIKL